VTRIAQAIFAAVLARAPVVSGLLLVMWSDPDDGQTHALLPEALIGCSRARHPNSARSISAKPRETARGNAGRGSTGGRRGR
jgi:hypothetical protein